MGGDARSFGAELAAAKVNELKDFVKECFADASNTRATCEAEAKTKMGGNADKFKQKMKEAASSAAEEEITTCFDELGDATDDDSRSSCEERACGVYKSAGGSAEDCKNELKKAAQKSSADLLGTCLQDAGCTTNTRGRRTCTEKDKAKECMKQSAQQLRQGTGAKEVSATDLKEAGKKAA